MPIVQAGSAATVRRREKPVRDNTGHGWVVLGISRSGRITAMEPGDAGRCGANIRRLADPCRSECDFVFVLAPRMRRSFEASCDALMRDLTAARRCALIFLRRRPPPECDLRMDGPVVSFGCSQSIFRTVLRQAPEGPIIQLCFTLLHAIMNGRVRVDQLAVRQLPYAGGAAAVASPPAPAALIMAHRGKRRYLDTALRYIARLSGADVRCRVGLDEPDSATYQTLAASYDAEFFKSSPHGVGPYVIRQELARRSTEPLFMFHDSDDVSCHDRFQVQSDHLNRTGCDLVGCHELRVDEMEREVSAIRFPLDVTAALHQYGGHRLWHPTSLIRREAFFKAGGFSTDRIIANDSQFLLRAYFSMSIRNVDEFVYIRRKHREALTVAPETSLESPARLELSNLWLRDFARVQRGELRLEESSLWPVARTAPYRLVRF